MPQRHHLAARGQTLLELLLAVLLLALLGSLALPLFTQPLQELRANNLRRQLHASLASARATAITHRQKISVCPSSDGQRCGGLWHQGWMLFKAGTGGSGQTAPLQPLRHEQPVAGEGVQVQASLSRPMLHFHHDGRSGNSNQTLRICLGGRRHGEVIINIAGRVRSKRVRTADAC